MLVSARSKQCGRGRGAKAEGRHRHGRREGGAAAKRGCSAAKPAAKSGWRRRGRAAAKAAELGGRRAGAGHGGGAKTAKAASVHFSRMMGVRERRPE